MANRKQSESRTRMPESRRIRTAYWLLAGGAFFIGASSEQLLQYGLSHHLWAVGLACLCVILYIAAALAYVVHISHERDEWHWF